jgi:hypothetical protein
LPRIGEKGDRRMIAAFTKSREHPEGDMRRAAQDALARVIEEAMRLPWPQ